MLSSEAQRLHASDASRAASAVHLAQVFDLYVGGLSPALAAALRPSGGAPHAADVVIEGILEVADRRSGDAVARYDLLRRSGGGPRHDAVLGHALIKALEAVLGAAFDDATRQAWADSYIRLVETVMAARRNRIDFVA